MSKLYKSNDQYGRDIIVAEDCKIAGGPWSNFAGREVKDRQTGQIYNQEGVRNFAFVVDNEHDIELLRDECVNVKMAVNDLPEEDDGIIDARVRVKVRTDSGNPPLKIMLRTGMKDENGNYVEPFKPFNLNRIAELDKLMFDTADFMLGISRRNAVHALYLNQAWLTVTYSPNPLDLKYAGMIEEDSLDAAVDNYGDEEERPF
jgi:hypothetical protein